MQKQTNLPFPYIEHIGRVHHSYIIHHEPMWTRVWKFGLHLRIYMRDYLHTSTMLLWEAITLTKPNPSQEFIKRLSPFHDLEQ